MMPSPAPPRDRHLAFFGGSFDPPHNGHLELADELVRGGTVDTLYFIPAAQNPHKANHPRASGEQRVAMLEAAIRNRPQLHVLPLEINRPGPSYTIETVEALIEHFPHAKAYSWVIGADQLPGLQQWHRIAELVRRLRFLVLRRPGENITPPKLPNLRYRIVETRQWDISSTDIRKRLEQGLPIDIFVPLPVLSYLRNHREIYQKPS